MYRHLREAVGIILLLIVEKRLFPQYACRQGHISDTDPVLLTWNWCLVQCCALGCGSVFKVMSEKLVKFINTKMGNTKSKSKTKGRRSKHSWLQRQDSKSNVRHDETFPNRNCTKEDPELTRLRDSIKNQPDAFILNNLMMCVEFFKNYDE